MPTVTDPSAFEEGSLGLQIVLFIVTFGIYGLYWYYSTNAQLAAGTDAEFSPVARTLLSLLPFLGLYWSWQFCNDAEAVTDQSGPLLFVLFIVFAPISWFLIQSGVNSTAASA
ncbi:hypothetical protein L593_05915 [Salinarchaeum sp. Harcht-Bsk1]|uniref:DUF4234 domain-containing protein n=1 Tax=Salinarchaeum sp. Harcht-Bsk1 TaxID=1333523 RepID=UPI00034238ED|nr:DUF4234 domain-containing protein [Salinarchaeum sp. Harcht-Bsk1]AGN01132.1 hypothetical protein L593_05915 [Salinarchaeum sp. Harcht-Bsk1]